EIVGFLGPNGAGKSTTMRILTGSLGATDGRAMIGGIDVLEDPRSVKRIVGYLPEVPPLYTEMTVRSFLRFCGRLKGAKDPIEDAERVMKRVALDAVAHRLIDHLSKGYRQRVGLAQALVHSPQVLILDEPTSGLDPAQRVEIRDLIRELAQGDVTVVLSTHVLSEVEAICDRAIIINRGRIVAQDTMESLARSTSRIRLVVARPEPGLQQELEGLADVHRVSFDGERTFQIDAAADIREAVANVAVSRGLLELGSQRGLEDVFLRLTRQESGTPMEQP
ncbi:MAG: ATP-binding cassette domain-containing protein, partial [Myxococcales bacterium]|nr:ATP-binding cassette domain-containing protein [Myxococcales bacterium]